MAIRTTILGMAGALMLTASPAALAWAQDRGPILLAQNDGAGPDEIVKGKPRRKDERPAPGDAQAVPSMRDQMAQPDVQIRRKKPSAAEAEPAPQPRDQQMAEPDPQKPRRKKDPAAEADQAPPPRDQQVAEPDPQKPRRKKDPAAEADQAPAPRDQQVAEPDPQKPRRKKDPAPDEQQPPAAEAPAMAGQPARPAKAPPRPDAQSPVATPDMAAEPAIKPRPPKPDAASDVPAPARPEPAAGKPVEAGQPQGGQPAVSGLSDDELKARMQAARRSLRDPALAPEKRAVLEDTVAASRREMQLRQARGQSGAQPAPVEAQQPAPVDAKAGAPNPVVDVPKVDPQAQRRAQAAIADRTDAAKLDDAALSRRLQTYRDLLDDGTLSRDTERDLRQRLSDDRDVLRSRVARDEDGTRRRPRPDGRPDFNDGPPIVIVRPPSQDEIPGILNDRRRSRDLDEAQLNRRIQVYRDAARDERYSDQEREDYIRFLEDDRNELRDRLVAERRQREILLRDARDSRELDVPVDVDIYDSPARPWRPTVWAAEVDDDAIEEQLVARPQRPLQRFYTRRQILDEPEVVMAQPEVRQSVPGVELDTIHFGFNEAFVREEEIANLERIGRIIEKIVAAHPDEVFMIEGHTDAVGDDAYNVELSRKRAEAVKAALVQYYVIAPDNLATVGLGERYLKIPTPDEESENRRVTLRRMTSLVRN